MISQFKDSVGGMELAAVVSLMILITNLALKGILGLIRLTVTTRKKHSMKHRKEISTT